MGQFKLSREIGKKGLLAVNEVCCLRPASEMRGCLHNHHGHAFIFQQGCSINSCACTLRLDSDTKTWVSTRYLQHPHPQLQQAGLVATWCSRGNRRRRSYRSCAVLGRPSRCVRDWQNVTQESIPQLLANVRGQKSGVVYLLNILFAKMIPVLMNVRFRSIQIA